MGSVQYHAYQLQKSGKITSTRQGLYKLHFQSGVFQDHEMKIFQVLNQETPREILMFIIEQKNPTQTDIVNRLEISAPSINWHVRRLIDLDIIYVIQTFGINGAIDWLKCSCRYQMRTNSCCEYFGIFNSSNSHYRTYGKYPLYSRYHLCCYLNCFVYLCL